MMIFPWSSLSAYPQVSENPVDNGGVSVAWHTAYTPSYSGQSAVRPSTRSAIIARFSGIEQANITLGGSKSIAREAPSVVDLCIVALQTAREISASLTGSVD